MTTRPDRPSIVVHGPAIRHLRRMMGLSLSDLAGEIGRSTSFVRSLENGVRVGCRVEAFTKLCFALRVRDRRVLMAYPDAPLPTDDVPTEDAELVDKHDGDAHDGEREPADCGGAA